MLGGGRVGVNHRHAQGRATRSGFVMPPASHVTDEVLAHRTCTHNEHVRVAVCRKRWMLGE